MNIFVFGSNLAGRHGAGAALHARNEHGAEYGVGVGLTGRAYAIPTKDRNLKSLPLTDVLRNVEDFIIFAKQNPQLTFNVTKVGCGLAGNWEELIAPMFLHAPENCILPDGWRDPVYGIFKIN